MDFLSQEATILGSLSDIEDCEFGLGLEAHQRGRKVSIEDALSLYGNYKAKSVPAN